MEVHSSMSVSICHNPVPFPKKPASKLLQKEDNLVPVAPCTSRCELTTSLGFFGLVLIHGNNQRLKFAIF
jgi:hypothetical protein